MGKMQFYTRQTEGKKNLNTVMSKERHSADSEQKIRNDFARPHFCKSKLNAILLSVHGHIQQH